MPTAERAGLLSLFLAVSLVSAGSAQTPNSKREINLDRLGELVRLEQRLRSLPAEAQVTVPNGETHRGDFAVASGKTIPGNLLVLEGDAELAGRVNGNLVVLDGDIILQPGGLVTGDALALGGRILDRGGQIQGERRSLGLSRSAAKASGGVVGAFTKVAGLAGVLFTLTVLGFGVVVFAQPQLETISDTVSNSALRAFLTGLLAQVVVLPTLGMFITGLVLSVVGIILVPFVLLVVPLLLIAAIVLGFLAVAHAMGETRLRRRMAAGERIGSANSYRYLLSGLASIALLWTGWAVFGWVPLAGTLVFGAALLATWLLATIGFGAALLSRGGIRPAFAGRYLPPEAMTDEYLWATPRFGVDAVKRPKK